MRYIDKSINRQKGEQIVSEFLNRFYQRKGAYPDDMYKAFSKEIDDEHDTVKFRQRLVNEVLHPEQDGRCCYCMRRVSADSGNSVEHIMPNHAVDKTELDLYRGRPTPLDGLPHADDFKSMSPVVYPPHPHSIAYQNLILSCNGDPLGARSTPVCCNLKRGHNFLPPFVLYRDIAQTFLYLEDGTAEWTEDPEPPESGRNVTRVLGLNRALLKMVRRIWFFCNDNRIDPHTAQKDVVVNTMIGYIASPLVSEHEVNMLLNFKNAKYWSLLLEYDAFATVKHCSAQ